MKNIFKYLAIIVTALTVFTACDDKNEDLYYSVGDANISTTQYLQFSSVNPVFAMTPTITEAFTAEVGVSIIGPPAAADFTVTINIVSNDLSSDQVTLASTTLTILAKTSKATTEILIDPNAFTLDPDTLKMSLSLSASGFETAPYGGTTTYQFVYNVCPFDILDYLGGFTCTETGYGDYGVNFFADPVVPNRIHNTNFWDYAAGGSTVYYDFSGDENQTIDIPEQSFTFGGGEVGSIVGSGTYDACTGTFYTLTDVTYEGSVYETEHFFFKGKSVIKTTLPKALLVKK